MTATNRVHSAAPTAGERSPAQRGSEEAIRWRC